jgi:hypothetical protein
MITTMEVPGTSLAVGVPTEWRTSGGAEFGLVAVEPIEGRFAANMTGLVSSARGASPEAAIAALTGPLLAPVIVDVHTRNDGFDIVLCHLVGAVSVTARQRQVLIPEGLLVVTFTAPSSRWGELCALAGAVVDSIGAAT